LAHHTGTRDSEDWTRLWNNVAKTLDPQAPLPLFATDTWDPAQEGLEEAFGHYEPVPYQGRGRPPHPVRVLPADLMYVQVQKTRQGRRIVDVTKRVVYGDAHRIQRILDRTGTTINTSFVERANLTTRTWNNRFTRRGIGFSKDAELHEHAIHLQNVYHNFLHYHRSLRKRKRGRPRKRGGPYRHRTPAMAQRITDHRWSWLEVMQWRPSLK
jgi:IS1 family transposase